MVRLDGFAVVLPSRFMVSSGLEYHHQLSFMKAGLKFAQRLTTVAGRDYILATTVFHAGVVAAQIGNALACRTERDPVHRMGWLSNRALLAGIAIEAVLILTLIYWAPLAGLFEHLPLPPVYWLGLVLYAPAVYLLEWLRKMLQRRKGPEKT